MVRNLSLNFLYRKVGTRVELESDAVGLISALASAESFKGKSPRVVSLSRVSFPFWIVQTSPTKSIVLSASSSVRQQFQFSQLKESSEIRRIVGSEVSQAADIPVAMSKISPLLDRAETYTEELSSMVNPTPFVSVGKYIEPSDPNAQPNRIEIRIDSGGALKRSEEFKGISETIKRRIEATEALHALFKEKFGGQYSILENLDSLERTRWNDRVGLMEERTEQQEITDLKKARDDKLYELREAHKMKLRALTAEFARAANNLEGHFSQISKEIRAASTEIGQKEDDVEGAISKYENLASSLRRTIERSNQPIDAMDAKKEELERAAAEARRSYEQQKTDAESALESQIEDRRKRIEDTKEEMNKKIKELDELKENTNKVIQNAYRAVNDKVTEFHQEFLSFMSWTLDNDKIQDLAPLTQLDVHTYVARYDNDAYRVIPPCFVSDVETTSFGVGQSLSSEFDDLLTSSINEWLSSDPSFKDAFERACITGNVFLDPRGETMLSEGLESLTRRKSLGTSDVERYGTLWYRYAGKCPKCGSELETGAKFCNNCGLELSYNSRRN